MYDGVAYIYAPNDTTADGGFPSCTWTKIGEEYYTERTVGYNRMYTAMQASEKADMLLRIHRRYDITTDCTVKLEPFTHTDNARYRVAQYQQTDYEGLPYTDLTLERIGELDA